MKNYNRILILGGPGSGKTTLAKILSKKYNLPVVNLDGINYLENWIPRDKKERDNIIISEANKDKWIIEGIYKSTLEIRAKRADLIIILDYKTRSLIYGVLKRYFTGIGKEKEEIKGCKEKIDKDFIKYIINFNKKTKNKYMDILYKIENIDDKIICFKNRKELNNYINKL